MRKFLSFENEAMLNEAAVDIILSSAKQSVSDTGAFIMALSGGMGPMPVYERLALAVNSEKFPWKRAFIFWSDERYTPADNTTSNFHAAYTAFLSGAPVNPRHIFRVPVEAYSAQQAAEFYEKLMRKFFGSAGRIDMAGMPVFDLIMLGVGADGHTASLFPGSKELGITDRWVISTKAPKGSIIRDRITFSIPVINSAKNVLILAPGDIKRPVIEKLRTHKKDQDMPVSLIDAGSTYILSAK